MAAENFRTVRKNQKLSQEAVAKKSGFSLSYISMLGATRLVRKEEQRARPGRVHGRWRFPEGCCYGCRRGEHLRR
jgi:hypothetical protein